ncbi:MAG: class I SAM-dependent methyltransferase [Methanoregula sp.]|nr:class I SAM-dependent methyltransferase [Methanoregula sp.]
MMGAGTIDWVQNWETIYDDRLQVMLRDYSIDHWTERAEDYSESRRTNNYEYGEKVFAALAGHGIIGSGSQVLEVGSGPGTFVIPFSKRVKHMTAVEPADGMIHVIHRNAKEAGVENYNIIPKIWQDVDINGIRGTYDLVITSTVIWMFRDIMQQITRMEEATRGHCCVVESVGGGQAFEKTLWHTIMGDNPYPSYPGYPLAYNLLYQSGRIPQVRIINSQSLRTFEKLMKMYRVFYSLYTEFTPKVEETIRSALLADSISGLHERNYQSAVVWWDPKERREIG